jgi:NADH dehydrogenase
VILGGGFAGVSCARALSSRRFDVRLVDRGGSFEFLPNIHELLSGVKTPDSLRLPLAVMLRAAGHRFQRKEAVAIDTTPKRLEMKKGPALKYDWLVLATGGIDATFGVGGVAEYGYPFKSVAQCARIGERLAELAQRQTPARVVVVGGGLEGVEALGEILRKYRRSNLQVTILEAQPRLLPEAPASLDTHIRARCANQPVSIRCGIPVQRLTAKTVKLANGESLRSDLTIWTGGPAPSPLLRESGLAPGQGWAPVDKHLRSTQADHVFVVGDAAELPATLPKQAYHAIDMGKCAARNVERAVSGCGLQRYRPAPKPTLVSFGDLSCMLVAGNFALAGPALGAAKEAIYELLMTQLDPGPLPGRLRSAVDRTAMAGERLLWPTLASIGALRRQGRITLLTG